MRNEVIGALFELCEINTLLLPLGVEVKEGGFIKIFKLTKNREQIRFD